MNLSLSYGQMSSPNTPEDAAALMPAGWVMPTGMDASMLAIAINDYVGDPGAGAIFGSGVSMIGSEGEG